MQTLYQATSFNATTVSGVAPVFVHNFVTNANVDPAPAGDWRWEIDPTNGGYDAPGGAS